MDGHVRGLPFRTSATISDFLTPLSANSHNLPYKGCLLCLLLKVPPPPLSADILNGSPLKVQGDWWSRTGVGMTFIGTAPQKRT